VIEATSSVRSDEMNAASNADERLASRRMVHLSYTNTQALALGAGF
jgi:hypothetical protein